MLAGVSQVYLDCSDVMLDFAAPNNNGVDQQLELNRPTNTEDKTICIIVVGVVFVLHVLGIRCDGNIIIEDETPVDLGDLRLVEIIFTVPIGISDTDVVAFSSVPFAGDVETSGVKLISGSKGTAPRPLSSAPSTHW